MAVAFRSSSTTGTSDAFVTSLNVPVPSGAASGDIALLAIEQWESANPTVTWPSGFTQVINQVSGSQKLRVAWKRLTAADTGNYTPTWTGSQWSQGQCILLTGGKASGDPIGSNTVTGSATSTSVPSLSTGSLTFEPFLAHYVANENSATGTPPTSFTETQEANYLKSNYRVPGTTGVQTAAGGTISTSSLLLCCLVAVEPEPAGGPATITGSAAFTAEGVMGSTARLAMLAAAAPTGNGNMTSAGTVTKLGASVLSAEGVLSSNGITTKLGAAAFSGEGVLGSSGRLGVRAGSALSGEGILTATAAGVTIVSGSADLSASGTLSAAGVATLLGATVLSGTGTLGAAAQIAVRGAAAFTATGTLVADGTVAGANVVSGACGMSAQSDLFATIRVVTFGAVVLTAEGVLSGNATVAGRRWRLKPPQHIIEHVIVGSLKTKRVVEETVFGDESGLFTSYDQNIPVGADAYHAIPFGTKYIWHGGSDNTTDDPAIMNLWLANGFDVEQVV